MVRPRFVAVLAAVLLAAGCDTSIIEPPQAQTVVLGVGEQVQTADGILTVFFIGVTDDSRCATDVVCVREGNGQVAIRLEPLAGMPMDGQLNTNRAVGPDKILFDGHTFELVSLDPLPLSTNPIPPGDYEVSLLITW